MAFSDNAIGFYLQLDDQLTPALQKAETGYTRFVKSIDTLNKQAVDKMNGGFQSMAALVNSFAQLPEAAVTGYKKARAALTKQIKDITQKVDLQFSAKGKKRFIGTIAEGVSKALQKAKLRLSVDIPLKRNKYFDTTLPLRTSYKEMLQPPDFTGFFKGLPAFQKGGVVPGPTPGTPDGPGRDKTLIWAEPGEVVFSKKAMGQLSQMPKAFREAAKGALEASNEVSLLKREVELGLDPEAPRRYATALGLSETATTQLTGQFLELSDVQRRRMLPHMEDLNELTTSFTESAQEADKATDSLGKSLGSNVGFLTARTIIGDLQNGFNDLVNAADGIGGQAKASTGEIDNMADTLFELGRATGMSRKESLAFGQELMAQNDGYGDVISTSERFAAALTLRQAGAGREFIKSFAADVAAFDKMGVEAAQTYYQLGDAIGLSGDATAAVMLNARRAGTETALGLQGAVDVVTELTAEGSSFAAGLADMTEASRQAAISGMVNMRAAMSEKWMAPLAESMQQTIGEALFDPRKATELANQFGMTTDAMREMVAAGNVTGIMEQMSTHLAKFGGDMSQIAPLAEALEIDPQMLIRFNKDGGAARDVLQGLSNGAVANADAQAELAKATAEQVPWFERMTNAMQRFVTEKVGLNVIDMLDGINFQMLASIGYLASMSMQALKAVPRLLGFGSAAGTAAGGTTMLGTAMGVLASPIVLVAGALVAIGAAIVGLLAWFGKLDEVGRVLWATFGGLWDTIVTQFGSVVDVFKEVGQSINKDLGGALDWFLSGDGEGLALWVELIGEMVATTGKIIVSAFASVVKFLARHVGAMVKLFRGFVDFFTDVWTEPGAAFSKLFDDMWNYVQTTFNNIGQFVADFMDGIGLLTFAQDIAAGVRDVFNGVVDWTTGAFTTLLNFFIGLPGQIKDGFVNLVTWLGGAIGSILDTLGITAAVDAVSGIFKAIVDAVMSPIETLKGLISTLILQPIRGALWDLGQVFFEMAATTGIGAFSSVRDLLWETSGSIPYALASGGLVQGPTRALVGEAGAEAVIPLENPQAVRSFFQPLAGELEQMMRKPVLSPQELLAVVEGVTASRDDATTQLMQRNNDLLETIADLIASQSGRAPTRPDAGAARSRVAALPTPRTMHLSTGGD